MKIARGEEAAFWVRSQINEVSLPSTSIFPALFLSFSVGKDLHLLVASWETVGVVLIDSFIDRQ